ncbi:MAG: S53 family peptidase, partial [Acidimicrobiales bacterium]
TAGPTVPAGLGIDGVIGLNSKLGAHTFDHKPPSSAPHGAAAPKPSQTTCAGGQCVGLTTPQDLWSIYDQPTDLSNSSADFGQGQQMAVLGEGAVSGVLADLRAFEKEHGLPQIRITIYPVGDTFTDTSGNGEWDIDMQASTGMSPKAYGETLYFANDLTDASVEGDFSAWGSDQGGPLQANASFGECEEDPTTAVTGGAIGASAMFTKASENTLQQATLQGKTLFSSTGDTGSSCPLVPVNVNGVGNEAFPETSYPASSPYVVGVGGTVLYGTPSTATAPASNSKRAEETAWTYTGGGNTFYIAEPAYQKGISLLDNQPCVSMPDGTPYAVGTPCRGIPDVAAQSGDVVSNGYDVTMGGVNDQAGAGTSLSSPLWMGMWTRVQAAAPADASGQYTLGFANPVLYKIGLNSTEDVKDFFDIGCGATSATCSGTGISPTTSNGYYDSLPRNAADASGWDYVSGLGAPDVTNLGKDATGNTTLAPTNPLTPPPPQDCGQPGLSPCTATCSPGGAVWTNPPHTATDTLGNKDPQLSLLEGAFKTSADGKTLQVLLTVTDLTKTVPTGAEADEWYMTWTYNKTEYFA